MVTEAQRVTDKLLVGDKMTYKTWIPEDFLPLRVGDVKQCVEDCHPSLIILNPKNEKFSKEIPEGIEVIYQRNILLWEIWMQGQVHAISDSKNNIEKDISLKEVHPPVQVEQASTLPTVERVLVEREIIPLPRTSTPLTVAPVAQNLTGESPSAANPSSRREVVEKIQALSKEVNKFGRPLSVREIKKRLDAEGIKISHETVWRVRRVGV